MKDIRQQLEELQAAIDTEYRHSIKENTSRSTLNRLIIRRDTIIKMVDAGYKPTCYEELPR